MHLQKYIAFLRGESKLLESARFKPTSACFWLNSFPSSPTKPLFVISIPITLSICIITTLTPPSSNYTSHEGSGVLGQIQPAGGVRGRHLCLKTRAEGAPPPPGLPAEIPSEAAPAAPSPGRMAGESGGSLFPPSACARRSGCRSGRGSHPRPRRR